MRVDRILQVFRNIDCKLESRHRGAVANSRLAAKQIDLNPTLGTFLGTDNFVSAFNAMSYFQ